MDYDYDDARADARYEQALTRCQCNSERCGNCPGPANCGEWQDDETD